MTNEVSYILQRGHNILNVNNTDIKNFFSNTSIQYDTFQKKIQQIIVNHNNLKSEKDLNKYIVSNLQTSKIIDTY